MPAATGGLLRRNDGVDSTALAPSDVSGDLSPDECVDVESREATINTKAGSGCPAFEITFLLFSVWLCYCTLDDRSA